MAYNIFYKEEGGNMNNDDKFTLLSKNKIKKDYILDSKYKMGISTDYAKFLGVVENDDKCCYWTCSSKNNIPYYVDEKNMQQNNNFLNDAFWHSMDKQCPNIHRKGK